MANVSKLGGLQEQIRVINEGKPLVDGDKFPDRFELAETDKSYIIKLIRGALITDEGCGGRVKKYVGFETEGQVIGVIDKSQNIIKIEWQNGALILYGESQWRLTAFDKREPNEGCLR